MRHPFYLAILLLFAFSSLAANATDEECQPWINCAQDFRISLPDNSCHVLLSVADLVNSGSPCGITPIVTIDSRGPYTIGTHEYFAVARVGNRITSCTGEVIVEDKTAPELFCLNEVIFTDDPLAAYEAVTSIDVHDNCDDNPIGISITDGTPGYGTFANYWSARDESLNFSSCTERNVIRPLNEVYCIPEANTAYEYIDRVEIWGADQTFTTSISGNDGGYGFYINRQTKAYIGEDIRLAASAGGNVFSLAWEVFIDFNNDGDFQDAGEQVYSTTGDIPNIDVDIHIPINGTYLGKRRMRVFLQYNALSGPCQAGNMGYGEYEDYLLDIKIPIFNQVILRQLAEQTNDKEIDLHAISQANEAPTAHNIGSMRSSNTEHLAGKHQIFPNPVQANTAATIQLENYHGLSYIRISNSIGQEVAHIPLSGNGPQTIKAPTLLAAGFYMVSGVDANNNPLWVERLIVR